MEAPGGPYDKQEGETGRSPEPGTTAYPRGKSPWVCHGLDPTVAPSPEATDSGLLRNQEVGCQKVTRLLFQMVRGRGPAGRQQSALPEAPGVP